MKLHVIRLTLLLMAMMTPVAHAELDTENIHRYFWANFEQFKGNQKAQHWYEQLLQSQAPLYFYKGYIHYLYDAGKFPQIIALMPKLEPAFAQDPDLQLIFARALERGGNQSRADEKLIKLSNQFKTHQEIAFQVAQLLVRRKEPENALKTIDDLLNNSPRKPNNFLFYFLKAQIYVQLNNKEEALKNVKISIDMYPHFDKGWLLLGVLEEQMGKLDEAIKGYTTFLELTNENSTEIEQHLLQLVFKQKIAQQKSSSITLAKSCFEKALTFFDSKDYQQALKQINQCLDQKPKDPESRLLKVQVLNAMRNHGAAANALKEWITSDPENDTWYKTLFLLCRSGLNYQKAIAVLEDVIHAQPNNLLALLYVADLCIRARSLDTALMYHKKALPLATDPHIKTKLLFNMGMLYHEQKKYADVEKVLEEGRRLDTNFMPLLNLLAYHYATHGHALEKAQQLLDTVLKKEGNNPHFLDTQALVFYKQRNYDKAVTTLKTAAEAAHDDPTILRHLGKTYYKLGKKQDALQTIEQALKVAQRDDERNKCNNLLKRWRAKTN